MKDIDRARREYYRVRVENLRSQIPMVRVLEHLGIQVHVNEDVEVQYPCPLHGDGNDRGFSARVYPSESDDPGGHTFCWGCQKARDQIQWVRDYEGLSFMGAVKYLEETFEVTDIPNIYDYFDPRKTEGEGGGSKFLREIEEILGNSSNDVLSFAYLERKIDRLVADTRDSISLTSVTRLYFVCDLLAYDFDREIIDEKEALRRAARLESKIKTLYDSCRDNSN